MTIPEWNSKYSLFKYLELPETETNSQAFKRAYIVKLHKTTGQLRIYCSRAYHVLSDTNTLTQYLENGGLWEETYFTRTQSMQILAEEGNLARLKEIKASFRSHDFIAELNPYDTSINEQNDRGQTPLYCACRSGQIEMVRWLIRNHANPEIRQRTQSTALHAASFFGHAEVVQILLEFGADMTVVNMWNSTPEKEAWSPEVKKVFKDANENPTIMALAGNVEYFKTHKQDNINFENKNGQSVLYLACKRGRTDLVKLLVETLGALINIQSTVTGSTPLHAASYYNHGPIVQYLLDNGADPFIENLRKHKPEDEATSYQTKDIFVEHYHQDLLKKVEEGDLRWITTYINDEQKIRQRPEVVNDPAVAKQVLYVAAKHGHVTMVRWLLENGHKEFINDQSNETESTPLHVACHRGHKHIAQILIETGADTFLRNKFEETPKENAMMMKHEEIVKLFDPILWKHEDRYLVHIFVYNVKPGPDGTPFHKLHISGQHSLRYILMDLPPIPGHPVRDALEFYYVGRRIEIKSYATSFLRLLSQITPTGSVFLKSPLCLTVKPIPKAHNYGRRVIPQNPLSKSDNGFDGPYAIQYTQNLDIGPSTEKEIVLQCQVPAYKASVVIPKDCVSEPTRFELIVHYQKTFPKDVGVCCLCLFTIRSGSRDGFKNLPHLRYPSHDSTSLHAFDRTSQLWLECPSNQLTIDMTYALISKTPMIPRSNYELGIYPDLIEHPPVSALPLPTSGNPVTEHRINILGSDLHNTWEVAYHGTCLANVASIVHGGLISPGFVTSVGRYIEPPINHIPRNALFLGVKDFANAVFVSPKEDYARNPCYCVKQTVTIGAVSYDIWPVLEVRVEPNSYRKFPGTTKDRKEPDLEWRVDNPASVRVVAVILRVTLTSASVSKVAY